MDADRVIILRPDAPQPLTANDVMMADAFLIGGIVDRIPRPGVSRVLDNLVPWGTPRKIELRGSIVGVPERLNRIIEILLKARYEYPGDIEKSIITSMTKKDIVARAYIEIVRNARRTPSGLVVSWDLYEELRKWLPITPDEFVKAAQRARARIVGEPPSGPEN
jgi:tRNA (adenine9-N1/guanine9-N1)-methyltransferase